MRSLVGAIVFAGLGACSLGLDGLSGGGGTSDGGVDGGPTGTVTEAGSSTSSTSSSSGDSGQSSSGDDSGTLPPPVAFVQAIEGRSDGLTDKLTLPGAVHAHDTIVVGFVGDNNLTAKNVTDSLGNTYTRVAGSVQREDLNAYLYVAYDVKGGADDVTIAMNGEPDELNAIVAEYSGLAPNGLDVAGTNSGADGAIAVNLTPTKSNDLLFAWVYAGTPSGDGTTVATSTFATRSAGDGQLVEDRILTQAGNTSVSATMTTGNGWVAIGAAFAPQ